VGAELRGGGAEIGVETAGGAAGEFEAGLADPPLVGVTVERDEIGEGGAGEIGALRPAGCRR
jgi:hypothetical protein